MSTDIQYYVDLITSQHRDKEKYREVIKLSVEGYVQIQKVLDSLPKKFDLDIAHGDQLDIIGIWVGVSRRIRTPLSNVYFSWDDPELGWEDGAWKGPFDPNNELIDLPDDSYRILIKAKIAANSWDGSITQASEIWESIFTNSFISLIDHQDMSMTVAIAGEPLDQITKDLLIYGYLPLKPVSVRIRNFIIVPDDGQLFGWDVDNEMFGGWDSGQWGENLTPA